MLSVELPYGIPRWLVYRGIERVALMTGVINGDTYTVRNIVPIRNEHPDPASHFSVSHAEAMEMLGQEYAHVIGVLHTHKSDCPEVSDDDLTGIPEGWIGGVIVRRRVTAWYTSDGVIAPHVRFAVSDALLYTA